MGRPTLYDPSYCEKIIDHMSEGASITSFAASIGIARPTIDVWRKANPEFDEAVQIAKAKACAWWERQSRKLAVAGGGNGASTMTIFGLKNMGAGEWADSRSLELQNSKSAPFETLEVHRIIVDPLFAQEIKIEDKSKE